MANVMKNQEKGKKGYIPWYETWEQSRDKVFADVHAEFDNMTEHEGKILTMATWEAWKQGVTDATGKMPDQGCKEMRFRAAVAAMQTLMRRWDKTAIIRCDSVRKEITDASVMMADALLAKLEES